MMHGLFQGSPSLGCAPAPMANRGLRTHLPSSTSFNSSAMHRPAFAVTPVRNVQVAGHAEKHVGCSRIMQTRAEAAAWAQQQKCTALSLSRSMTDDRRPHQHQHACMSACPSSLACCSQHFPDPCHLRPPAESVWCGVARHSGRRHCGADSGLTVFLL